MEPGLFGIPGLTVGGAGIWSIFVVIVGIILKTWLSWKKLSFEDRAALTSGFSAQVANLQEWNIKLQGRCEILTSSLEMFQAKHLLCEQETSQLRIEVLGIKRQMHAIAHAVLRDVSPERLEGTVAGALIDELIRKEPLP